MKELAFKFFWYIFFSVTLHPIARFKQNVIGMLISKPQIYHAKLYSKSHTKCSELYVS